MADEQRRAPAVRKDIEDIDERDDIRVRVVGTVLSLENDSISVDDGTGTVEVFLDEGEMDGLGENQMVRVLGRVLPTPDGFEIQGEILQDFSDVDPERYKRIKKIVSTTS
jgi:hypothetical protein